MSEKSSQEAPRPKRGERDLKEFARDKIAYFTTKVERKARPDDHLALELARWWLRLMEQSAADRQEVRRLLASLETRTTGMSRAWVELEGEVDVWARSLPED